MKSIYLIIYHHISYTKTDNYSPFEPSDRLYLEITWPKIDLEPLKHEGHVLLNELGAFLLDLHLALEVVSQDL